MIQRTLDLHPWVWPISNREFFWFPENYPKQNLNLQGTSNYLQSICIVLGIISNQKEMATHSSVLAWRIPGTEETGRLLSLGSHRVRHDWSDLAAAAADIERAYSFRSVKLENKFTLVQISNSCSLYQMAMINFVPLDTIHIIMNKNHLNYYQFSTTYSFKIA